MGVLSTGFPAGAAPQGRMTERLVIDGSHGEGGGQILRSALGLAAITGRRVTVENIRARRKRPGLAAQHLAAVRALAEICDARLEGDSLDSVRLDFEPRSRPRAGRYRFDIGAEREGGSAGSVALVLQAVAPVLAHADGESEVQLIGGTHVIFSPSYDYARDVWLPAFNEMGLMAELQLARWGWYPAGQGEVHLRMSALAGGVFRPLQRVRRGHLNGVWGRSVVTRLPVTVASRMANRVGAVLAGEGITADIALETVASVSVGAGVFFTAQYEFARAGFTGLGARGKPAELVAEEAARAFLAFHRSAAAVDRHLGDQLIVPAALAGAPSRFQVEEVSDHLTTSAWLVERFAVARVGISGEPHGPAIVTVTPHR